ncbi:MAG: gamma-glutamyltransferase [bacterium]|nr:gamma-glutamyltransferase [bacterium]
MPSFIAFLIAGALWATPGGPPPELPPEMITRVVPEPIAESVIAPTCMVASAHPLASRAGAAIMQSGGNAVDAALAVQAMLSLVEPESSGPGGGCFILYHDLASDSLYALDGREELPRSADVDMFRDAEGNLLPEVLSGGLSVGVPGTVAAWSRIHARFGKLPLSQVLAPAIAAAEAGFPVPADMARGIRSQRSRLERFAPSRALYFHENGDPYDEGELFRNPDLARTLRLWAADPTGGFFYRGPLAEALLEQVRDNPFRAGSMVGADLEDYRAVFRQPISGHYRGRTIGAFPPPTSGGITLLEILGLMETRPRIKGALTDDAVLLMHLDRLARASRIAFADRGAWLGDPDFSPEIPMRDLLKPEFIKARAAAAFDPNADLTPAATEGPLTGSHTTHFSVVDAEGNMLSCTSTIEYIFGCGMVVPGYGFPLNNELTDFNLFPSDPPIANDAVPGLRERSNSLEADPGRGGKRPRSSMCPIIVYDTQGKPEIAVGSPGGSRIIGTVTSVLLCLLDFEMGLQEALNFPRLHCRNRPLEIETFGWNREALAEALETLGWEIAPLGRFPLLQGDVNAVRILPDGRREGAADPRHDGGAFGG